MSSVAARQWARPWGHSRASPNVQLPHSMVLSFECTRSERISGRGLRGDPRLLEERLGTGHVLRLLCVPTVWGRAVVLGALQVTGSGQGQGRHGRLAQSSGAVAASPATVLGHLDSGQCRPHRNKSFIVLNFCQQIKNFHNETCMGAGCIVREKQRGSPTL